MLPRCLFSFQFIYSSLLISFAKDRTYPKILWKWNHFGRQKFLLKILALRNFVRELSGFPFPCTNLAADVSAVAVAAQNADQDQCRTYYITFTVFE